MSNRHHGRRSVGARAAAVAALCGSLVLGACTGPVPAPEAGAPSVPDPCLVGAPGNDCVGITDGSVNLTGDRDFDRVYSAVQRENQRVAALGPTVSIVYTLPVPRVPGQLSVELRHELQGAHLLQLRANDASSDLAGAPYVQLQIANLGSEAAGWRPVVERIKQMAADPTRSGHVVGVAGLGQSLTAVRDAMDSLRQARIPMVPARLTADGISPQPGVDGVFRIAPPNSAQIAAAARYLTSACRPLLVQDARVDDLYVRDLTANFPVLAAAAATRSAACAGPSGEQLPIARYDSSLPGVDVALQQRISDLCQRNPDTVYFGGRGANLPAFVAALGARDLRTCPGPITVVTADDGLVLASVVRSELATNSAPNVGGALARGVRVVATALASPGEWGATAAQDPALVGLAGSCTRCLATVFPGEPLDTGDIIMGHDAVLTLVRAVRAGASQQDPTVSSGTVLQALLGFGQTRPIAGASGPIGFDGEGKPVEKNVPVVTIDARGAIIYAGLG